ncbi:hypothetical protein PENSPDRAFT_693292 [Peniophora sp. CONT]|nr:hypothetical protein PENSPDRAFT_693292 [Peniophora sp. CONT]
MPFGQASAPRTPSIPNSPHDELLQISPSSNTDSQPEYTPFKDLISGGSAGILGTTSSGLEILESLLEAFDKLPLVKYLVSVGIQLVKHVIKVQVANDMFKNLAFRARDVIVAVARSCQGMHSMEAQLEDDLRQLTGTMDSILTFTAERVNRKGLQRLLSKSDDSAAVKALDKELTHACNIFGLQSSISNRSLLLQQSPATPVSPTLPRPEFVANCHLRVREGIYIIKNVADGRVIETEDHKLLGGGGVHAYMAPCLDGKLQTQVWSIQKVDNQEFEFMIRSMATGLALDIYFDTNRQGSKVCTHFWNGGGNETWSIWGTRQGVAEDYCTIRSTGLGTILDGLCPKDRLRCDELHATAIPSHGPTASQEWNLIRISSLSADLGSHALFPDVTFPRRPLLLQNALTGTFATRTNNDGPNVILSPSPTPFSSWTFVYSQNYPGNMRTDCFAIASSSDNPCTMDHYRGAHINVSKSCISNKRHMWAPVARDGVFIFRNVESGALLAASGSQQRYVDTVPASARGDPVCHWRLLDATNKEHIRVLCDSGLSVMPPELSGSAPVAPPPPIAPELRTGTASPETRLAMLDSFAQEHDAIRNMLLDGYKALIVAPRMITGWRDGKMKRVEVGKDEDAEFQYRAHVSLHPCQP